MHRILVVYGTRPEAIKMAPLLPALIERGMEPVVAVTGQHREMLDQVNDLFGIVPAFDLDLSKPRQTLAHITSSALPAVNDLVRQIQPAAVVVQGDTSTTFAAGLAAFYEQVPVVHVEAGLRTGKRYSPFPEEMNRKLTTQLADLHLPPTATSAQHLRDEGISDEAIAITGNTVIDALLDVSRRRLPYTVPGLEGAIAAARRVVLVTTHRRESWGDQMVSSMSALRDLAAKYPDDLFVLPMHRNPVVRDIIEPLLGSVENVMLIEPLDYAQFVRLMSDSYLVLTDSGGVQEEAPSLGKPVLVMREDTERPEAIEAGTARLIGTARETVFAEVSALMEDAAHYAAMANAVNPYGDGQAAPRSAAAIAAMLGIGDRLPDFAPNA